MNRKRLKKLRNALEDLRPCTEVRNANSPTGYAGTVRITDTDTLCEKAAGLPAIDTLDMRVEHGVHTDGSGRTRVLGCVSGMAILLYPQEAAEAARTLPDAVGVCDATDIAQHVLGLEDETADMLFNGHPDDPDTDAAAVRPRHAAIAVERVMAGIGAPDIWNHVHPTAGGSRTDHGHEHARDFLDRRDEARISHRLGRPFRF